MVDSTALLWIILCAPLVACVIITVWTVPSPKLSAGVALMGMLTSCVSTATLWYRHGTRGTLPFESSINWISFPDLHIEFGLLLDPLSFVMLTVVTGVGTLIFLYASGYMQGDPGYSRFFASLSMFAFSMLGIVLSNNWISLFIFWELVGLASYLLIGHWFEKPSAADASKKAFLVNRVADVGFMVGILMLWGATGVTSTGRTFNFLEQTALVSSHAVTPAMLGCAGLLIFCGVLGKSAQFPLHVWLPDAMEGPTPVSALIHAATMVAAGIYLLSRAFFVFVELPETMYIIAWVGGGTALLAALIAIVQSDLKRILAYSTLSQLGYMVMALGLGGYTAGMYHLTTHACFKALLFLAAGSVIRALHHEQNIWRMGGLVTQMPITTWTFAIGTFALCGIPPLSGFWSKDEILTVALQQHHVLYLMGTCTAGLTAFYMGRALFVTFGGTARSEHTAHESPFTMTFPLICLAILSLGAGYIGIPHFIHHHHGVHVAFSMRVATISTAVAITGLTLAYLLYVRLPHVPVQLATRLSFLHHILTQKFFVDAFYSWVVRYVQGSLAWLCAQFERFILIGCMVNGVAWATRSAGHLLRLCQTGHVQTYGIVFLAGVVLLTWHWLRPW